MTAALLPVAIADKPEANAMRIGTVASVDPFTVSLQGGDPIPVGLIAGAAVAVGSPVALIWQGSNWLALGSPISGQLRGVLFCTGDRRSPVGSTSSGSYATAWSSSINKRLDNTLLRCVYWGTFFTNTAAVGGDFAIRLNGGSDVLVAVHRGTMSLNNHEAFWGVEYIGGQPAGNVTIDMRWRINTGAGTITSDGNDFQGLEVMEVG